MSARTCLSVEQKKARNAEWRQEAQIFLRRWTETDGPTRTERILAERLLTLLDDVATLQRQASQDLAREILTARHWRKMRGAIETLRRRFAYHRGSTEAAAAAGHHATAEGLVEVWKGLDEIAAEALAEADTVLQPATDEERALLAARSAPPEGG